MKYFPQLLPARRGASSLLLPLLGLVAIAAPPQNARAQTPIDATQRLAIASSAAPDSAAPAPVLISELRAFGPKGSEDAFVELFNTTSQTIALSGWSLQFRAEKGAVASLKFAPGTRIGARGHLLLTGSKYSLQAVATGDIPLNARLAGGVRLANPQGQIIDAVGPQNSEIADREGAGLPAFIFAPGAAKTATNMAPTPQFSLVRSALDGQPQDSGDNARDFSVISVTGRLFDQKTRIGTPGPENAASPRLRPLQTATLESTTNTAPAAQNPALQPIALQTDPERNSMRRARRDVGPLKTFGTMTLRYRLVNDTPNVIKNLWFRVNSITADPNSETAPAGSADVRLIRGKAGAQTDPEPLPAAAKTSEKAETKAEATPRKFAVAVWRARLAPAPSQPLGGGLNAFLSIELPAGGIAPGASGEIWFSLGVERRGNYRLVLGNQTMNLIFEGNTEDDLSNSEKLDAGFVRSRQRSVALIQSGAANSSGIGGPNPNLPGVNSAASNGPETEESDASILQGNTEEGVPTPPKPSSKAS